MILPAPHVEYFLLAPMLIVFRLRSPVCWPRLSCRAGGAMAPK